MQLTRIDVSLPLLSDNQSLSRQFFPITSILIYTIVFNINYKGDEYRPIKRYNTGFNKWHLVDFNTDSLIHVKTLKTEEEDSIQETEKNRDVCLDERMCDEVDDIISSAS